MIPVGIIVSLFFGLTPETIGVVKQLLSEGPQAVVSTAVSGGTTVGTGTGTGAGTGTGTRTGGANGSESFGESRSFIND